MTLVNKSGWIMIAALGLCLAALFHYFLYVQHLNSWGSGDWSHAYFIPFISVYLLWQRRDEIARTPIRPFWPGLLPILVSVPTYALFQVSALSNHMAQGWATILCIFGVVLLVCGPRMMKLTFLPIAFLIFGITISEKVMIIVTFQLQLIASGGAWALLNLVGINTDLFGNVLKVTDSAGAVHDLNVAEACSGMRMVIAFAALGVAVALAGVQLWWQRTALVLLAVPVAILMNILRVAVLGIATLYDPNLAAGQSHMLIGTLLLLPAFALYMGIVWLLNTAVTTDRKPAASSTTAPSLSAQAGKAALAIGQQAQRTANSVWASLRQPAFIAAMTVLVAAAVTLNGAVAALGVHLRKDSISAPGDRRVAAIATETRNYQRIGQDYVMTDEVVEQLGTKNHVTRAYRLKNPAKNEPNPRLELHLAYYTGMIDTVPHVPERCMTGAGWQVTGFPKAVALNLDSSDWRPDDAQVSDRLRGKVFNARLLSDVSNDAKAERVRLPFDPQSIAMLATEFAGPRGGKLVGGYFFVANGGHTASAEGVRQLAFNLTDDYAYYLKVQVTSSDVATAEELAAASARLLNDLLPEIMRCVPDWVEVQQGRYPPDNRRRPAAQP